MATSSTASTAPKPKAKASRSTTENKPKRTRAESQKDKNAAKNDGIFKDASEILDMIKQKGSDLEELRTRMEDDYDIYRLMEYESKSGYKR